MRIVTTAVGVLVIAVLSQPALAASVSQSISMVDGVTVTTTTTDGQTTTTTTSQPGVAPGTVSLNQLPVTVPSRPLDVAARYLALTPAQAEAREQLDKEYDAAHRAAVEALDARLDAEYTVRVLQILSAQDREQFTKILELTKAYHAETRAAQEAYAEAMTGMGIDGAYSSGYGIRPQYLVYRTPGLTEDERKAVQKVYGDLMSAWNKEISARLSGNSKNPPKMRDREAWRQYSQKRREIRDAVYEEHQPELLEGFTAVMSEATGKTFGDMIAAADALTTRRDAARVAFQSQLEALIGPERAKGVMAGAAVPAK